MGMKNRYICLYKRMYMYEHIGTLYVCVFMNVLTRMCACGIFSAMCAQNTWHIYICERVQVCEVHMHMDLHECII